jgi:hypothetical protein
VAKATTKDKKKKKKKKKFARKLPPPNPLSNQPAAASPKDGGRNRSGDGLDYVAGGAPAIPEPELNDENKAFEEWRNLLMARPDVVLMDRFIREFQSNLVTANVFYAILDLMIQDKNPKFHELAVRGAGAVTTLQSFDFLVSAIHSLPSGSIAANHAQNELYEYDSPMAIPVIHTILTARAGSADVVLLAVQSLDRSTQNYLERAPATPPNTPPNTNSNLILYRGLLPTLENILNQYAGQREIAEPARRAVDRIRARFGQSLADLTNPAVVPGF